MKFSFPKVVTAVLGMLSVAHASPIKRQAHDNSALIAQYPGFSVDSYSGTWYVSGVGPYLESTVNDMQTIANGANTCFHANITAVDDITVHYLFDLSFGAAGFTRHVTVTDDTLQLQSPSADIAPNDYEVSWISGDDGSTMYSKLLDTTVESGVPQNDIFDTIVLWDNDVTRQACMFLTREQHVSDEQLALIESVSPYPFHRFPNQC